LLRRGALRRGAGGCTATCGCCGRTPRPGAAASWTSSSAGSSDIAEIGSPASSDRSHLVTLQAVAFPFKDGLAPESVSDQNRDVRCDGRRR
jgi:hypothetical protein